MALDVFQIPGKDWHVQYDVAAGWGGNWQRQFCSFAGTGNYVPLLPLLEHAWDATRSMVGEALQSAACEAAFPFEPMLATALQSRSSHWASLAIAWLEQGYPMSDTLASLADALELDRSLSQKGRHQLRKIVAQYRRNLSPPSA